MGTGKRYIITSMALVEAALLDKYGAYDAGLNPNGVVIYYMTTTSIIFSCLAICDKVIRFMYTHGFCYYGDSWTSGDAVDNQITFGGSGYYSTVTAREIILTDNCFIANWSKPEDATTANDRLIIVGKMSNGKYLCAGGYQYSSYQAATAAYITDGNVQGLPVAGSGQLLSPGGEIYKSKVYFGSMLGEAQVNADGSLAYLLDVESSYYQSIHLAATSTYVLTSSICGIGGLYRGFINSLLIELQQ